MQERLLLSGYSIEENIIKDYETKKSKGTLNIKYFAEKFNQNTLATVEDTLNTYELMSNNFFQIAIQREETTEFQMIHPHMKKMKVIGWEII